VCLGGIDQESTIYLAFDKYLKRNGNSLIREISLLSTYEIHSNILLARMAPYSNKIIGEFQCGFRRNRSTVENIFSIRKILEKWEYINKRNFTLVYLQNSIKHNFSKNDSIFK